MVEAMAKKVASFDNRAVREMSGSTLDMPVGYLTPDQFATLKNFVNTEGHRTLQSFADGHSQEAAPSYERSRLFSGSEIKGNDQPFQTPVLQTPSRAKAPVETGTMGTPKTRESASNVQLAQDTISMREPDHDQGMAKRFNNAP
ncbi:hypothetical protein BU24DRAFT_79146 [Aaosphaeria arxii CBS 175.79]|uniref:Uncharacterized protein n=1 Tax=Aaosphaeria arxii CBS 175.79 TaxID=1450172 RepID=A0A6A5X9G3_9PLEO|nr:uncharacterized protein BU24DRAFT_79146 [Aaosphaeria arxii CBS 175.79]KAF2009602.1 hypothetical protein BU24DRAFT_79146 [Aaosphaeria arxii CBS 175.79]